MMFRLLYLPLCLILLASQCFAARQGLDEAMGRKSRLGMNTFYSGDSGSPLYSWQPQTLMYNDNETSHEVWMLAWKPDAQLLVSKEYSNRAFSYNGSKIAFMDANSPRSMVSSDPSVDEGAYALWLVNTDGTKMRESTGLSLGSASDGATLWANTELAYYAVPVATDDKAICNGAACSGLETDKLYKCSITDATNFVDCGDPIYHFDNGYSMKSTIKESPSPTDAWFLAVSDSQSFPTPLSVASRGVYFLSDLTGSPTLNSYFGIARKLGPTGGHLVRGSDGTSSWQCNSTHVADATNRPTSGASYSEYWTDVSSIYDYRTLKLWGGSHVKTGDMEGDGNWSSTGTPETNERSSAQAHGGTYSRHVVDSTASKGGISQAFTSETGNTYQGPNHSFRVGFWYYIVSGEFEAKLWNLSTVSEAYTAWSATYTTTGSWQHIEVDVSIDWLQAGVLYLQFLNSSASVAAEFYIDDVSGYQIYSEGPYADPFYNIDNATQSTYHGGSLFNYAPGGNSTGLMLTYSGTAGTICMNKSGSASDGGPLFQDWNGTSFGANEVRACANGGLRANGTTLTTKTPMNPYINSYLGHQCSDRWHRYLFVDAPGDSDYYKNTVFTKSCMILDIDNNFSDPSWVDADTGNTPVAWNAYKAGHKSWTGWTDYVFHAPSFVGTPMVGNYYNKSAAPTHDNYRAEDNIAYNNNNKMTTYNSLPKPSQSPDGTKAQFQSILLNSAYTGASTDDLYSGIAYVVVYYPNPPLIAQVTQSSGTITVRVGWDLTGTPRGYTERGWPNETLNNPPPPREVEKFRLWRSGDKTTWIPIKTFSHTAWTGYNFATGVWTGNDYWDTTDSPGTGTWYYAVTSVEYSGIESRNLSNIYVITIGASSGSEDTAYPSTRPYGGLGNATSAFYTAFSATNNSKLIRYYNVYAKDGGAPSISQATRIASISKNACSGGACSWVDWLGNTDGSTQYVLTAVDTQGNESTGLTVAATHQKSPATAEGQYTLEWNEPADESEANPHHGQSTAGSFTGTMR